MHNDAKKDKPTLFLSFINVAQGYKKADFVRKSIQFCLDQGVIIDLLLLDRGFFAVDVTNTISDMQVQYFCSRL